MEKKRVLSLDLPERTSAFLWGARKTGKSTYLREHFADSLYYDLLESDRFLLFAKEPWRLREEILAADPARLVLPIVIDEVQKVPLLLDEVHGLIENHKLRFVLCGSSARKLRRGQANLLGGRAWRFSMHPFVSAELPSIDLLRVLSYGLIPAHYESPDPRRALDAYIADYLKEEIQVEGLTRNLPAFARFLEAVGFCNGQLVNFANVARDCGVDAKTVREYFYILVDTLLGFFVEPWRTPTRRLLVAATPKFYLFDVGLAGRLSGRALESLKGASAGQAFEHFIAMELIAFRSYREQDYDLTFWRTKTGLEVDFVLSLHDRIVAIETTIASRVDKADYKGLAAFLDEHPKASGYLVCLEPRARRIEIGGGAHLLCLPWLDFLERLWAGKIW